MPAPRPVLSLADAHDLAASAGFAQPVPGCPPAADQVGLEQEWLVFRATDLDAPVAEREVRAALGRPELLPAGSRVTFEPGGQVEVSSPPRSTLAEAIALTTADAATLDAHLAAAGLQPVALGLDPARPRRRVLDTPRYRAMAEHFGRSGSAGSSMMCATASLQVNVGLGDPDRTPGRWRLAHDLGPVLAATFANSPLCGHRPSGWHSTRLAVWQAIDPSRTGPARAPEDRREPGRAWADYALDAQVMLLRVGEDRYVVPAPMTFAEWLTRGHPLGHPTPDDLGYHLTTLFPPVRPRGWLELRMLDALPDPWWQAAAAVTTTLLLDEGAPAALDAALAPTRDRWLDAARAGLEDPTFATAAAACVDRALDLLTAPGADPETIAAVCEYRARFVARGRTPADDRLDAWQRTGELLPPAPTDARAVPCP